MTRDHIPAFFLSLSLLGVHGKVLEVLGDLFLLLLDLLQSCLIDIFLLFLHVFDIYLDLIQPLADTTHLICQ